MRRFTSSLMDVLLSGLLLMASASDGRSQSFQGGLRGAVKDVNGVIPGVGVKLINEATNVERGTVSNEVGEYVFAAVAPGTYTVRAVLTGFKTFERKGLAIGTQQFITIDLLMEVGTIQEQVSVTAAAPLIETSNASTGEVLDTKTLEALPALNRNMYMTGVTVPTVIASGDPYYSRMEDQSNGSLLSLGGGPRRANNYLLDGVSYTDMLNRTTAFPSLEAIQEVKVQVHTYDAEMGRSGGGVFNTTGRSGSNTFHGSGFFQDRPNWAAAPNFFDALAGRPKPQGPYYQYGGGSFGGPILRNKTFFWVATEDYRTNSTATGLEIFPTDRERAGNFSQSFNKDGTLDVIYDPLTTRPNPNGTGFIRDPFPGNIIPANRLSQVASNITKLIPQPNQQISGANGAANYQFTSGIPTWARQITTKIEHKFTDKESITGMYLYQPDEEQHQHLWAEQFPFADPDQGLEKRRVHILALNNTLILNPTTVLTLRYGWTRFEDDELPLPYNLAGLGFPSSFVNNVQYQMFPQGNITGYGLANGSQSTFGNRSLSPVFYDSWATNGTVSKFVGRHTFKFGGDFRHISMSTLTYGFSGGVFNFDRGWTQSNPFAPNVDQGNAFASFMLGLPSGNPGNLSYAPQAAPFDVFIHYYGGYAQDDFRLSSKLTLNYGLRYEYEAGLREHGNRFTAGFDQNAVSPLGALTGLPLKGGLEFAGQNGYPDYQGNPSKTKFSPRLGIASTLNDKTVVRGGYGLFWSPWIYTAPSTTNYGQIGYTSQTFVNQQTQLSPTASLDNPFPNGLLQPVGSTLGLLTGVGGGNVQYVDQNRQSPRVQQYSVDLQRELPGQMAASIGYVGTRGDNLGYGGTGLGQVNINQLDPKYLALGTALVDQVQNPFYGIPQAGAFSTSTTIARGQLLRPFPQFGNVFNVEPTGAISRYNALVLKLEKRLSHGWGGRFNYTFSRLDDDVFGEPTFFVLNNQGGKPLNSYNLIGEYSRSLLDQPHRVVLSPIVELPFGKGKQWATNGLANIIAGGWTVAAIASYASGYPLNVVQAVDNTGSFSGVQRPNWTGVDPNTPGSTTQRLNTYVNPAAYVAAAPFSIGTAPRTDPRIRSPFQTNYDVEMTKSVNVRGPLKAEIRLEVLNATNNPKFFGAPNAVFGNSAFGTITSQAGFPRTAQFLFRLHW